MSDVPIPSPSDGPYEEPGFVARLRARDERAFDQLVRGYERRVYALVVRMLGNPAEAQDVAQEVFVQVFRAIEQFRGDSKLSTWIFRIAVNLSKNRALYLQRRHSGQRADNEDAHELGERVPLGAAAKGTAGDVARPDQLVEGMQVERIVQAAIAELEASFRECLLLREVEDMSYEEIAEVTGLPAGTVKSRIHRARAQVRLHVETKLGEQVGGKVAVQHGASPNAAHSRTGGAKRARSAGGEDE
ncbi:MAG: sigma-70 family RNA polymerase sigma factor [Deltaproteobacteria bacterium]|nr:sigma-70 family RNA polymerase sigma factor [Deltaproteobacteria bacterium]